MTIKRYFQRFSIVLITCVTGSAAVAQNAGLPTISDGEKALDMWQVQSLMSKHEFYHGATMNLQEVDALWVAQDGPNSKTACFFSPSWVMQGVATVRKLYGEGHVEDMHKTFNQLQQAYPELANVEFKGSNVGGEFAMHTSTTPIIEVAGDGKTAKGVWYSPGIGLMPHVSGKSVEVGGIFFWEKYAGDFVKENGAWKIWHLGMYYDFAPSLPTSMTSSLGNGVPSGQPGASGGIPPGDNREKGEKLTPEEIAKGGMLPSPYSYPAWSPTRRNLIVPKFPEAYYTFSETFSYGPYDSNSQYKMMNLMK